MLIFESLRNYLFGSVVLGTNRCDESLPALLGEAECAWLKLQHWEDFRKESECTNWLVANKALEITLGNGSVITVTYWPEKDMVHCSTDVYIIIYNTYNTWKVAWPTVLHLCGCGEGFVLIHIKQKDTSHRQLVLFYNYN